jgi:predicted dehydrogenase
MAPTQPIRIALVGLTTNPSSSVTAWLNNVHLPYLLSSPHYIIAAVLCTTLDKAHTAISHFNLPASTKAYSSAEDLANDPDIDLVSVVVKAPSHRAIAHPLLQAGKNLCVEWPLDTSFKGTQDLASLAHSHGVKSIIGLQARQAPVVKLVKQQVSRLGRILSTTVVGTVPGTGTGEAQKNAVRYSLDQGSGATMVDVHTGHCKSLGLVGRGWRC